MPNDHPRIPVIGTGGLRGVLLDPIPNDPDQLVRVQVGERRILETPAGLLKRQADGSYAMPFSAQELDNMTEEPKVVPVVAEELDIRKRAVPTGGVRVHRRVLEHEEEVDMDLQREHVQVKRVLFDQEVEGPLPIRREGDTLIIPVVEEEVVVTRRYRLKEEVHVVKTVRTERYNERIPVQRQEAIIEEFDADGRSVMHRRDPR